MKTLPNRICGLLVPLFLLLTLPAVGQAQFEGYTSDGGFIITHYAGSGGAVTIPDSIEGLPVIGIGDTAFAGANLLNTAIYPGINMTSITIPDSVTNMGNYAFYYCTNLTSVNILAGVSRISTGEFCYCTSLTNIAIPDSIISIGDRAFEVCGSLKNIKIGNGVTNIGSSAFYDCGGLTNIVIPSSVTNIGDFAFILCFNLMAITVDAGNPNYSSAVGILFNKNQTKLIEFPGGIGGSRTVPGTVTSIGNGAFADCFQLTSITIPASVTNIGDYAFSLCTHLSGIYFKGNPPIASLDVFQYDNNATVYYLPGTVGWLSSFGGIQTVLWDPGVTTTKANFGVRNNRFGFTITGTASIPIVVEASTNFGNAWVPLQSVSITNGSFYFSDPQWTNFPGRFYRLRSP